MPLLFLQAQALISTSDVPLWLDFAPSATPMLLFDGTTTFLTGAVPQGAGWARTVHGWRWEGQHPALVANTCTDVEPGLRAAGVLLPSLGATEAPALAALLVHEAFHVWQQAHPSPAWNANELAALSYPDTVEVLHARAEEAHWLAEALLEPGGPAMGHALFWRAQRFAALEEDQRQLERRLETLEGLAQPVEQRFLGQRPALTPDLALRSTVRAWAYHSGAALAHLLSGDDWKTAVTAGEPLDTLLAREHAARPAVPQAALRDQAAWHASQRQQDKHRQLQAFQAAQGVRLQVSCEDGLVVQGFDPMNVTPLTPGRWLHHRFLALSHPSGQVEIRHGLALTEGPSVLRATRLEIVGLPQPLEHRGRWQVQAATHRIDLPAESVRAMPDGFDAAL